MERKWRRCQAGRGVEGKYNLVFGMGYAGIPVWVCVYSFVLLLHFVFFSTVFFFHVNSVLSTLRLLTTRTSTL